MRRTMRSSINERRRNVPAYAVEEMREPSKTTDYSDCSAVGQKVASLKSQGLRFKTEPSDERSLWQDARVVDQAGSVIRLYPAGENCLTLQPWVKCDAQDRRKAEYDRRSGNQRDR